MPEYFMNLESTIMKVNVCFFEEPHEARAKKTVPSPLRKQYDSFQGLGHMGQELGLVIHEPDEIRRRLRRMPAPVIHISERSTPDFTAERGAGAIHTRNAQKK